LNGDLLEFGLDPDDTSPGAQAAFDAAAEAAWDEYGASFMAEWDPTPAREIPWAVEKFGLPPGWR
jgi:hypothetical protein